MTAAGCEEVVRDCEGVVTDAEVVRDAEDEDEEGVVDAGDAGDEDDDDNNDDDDAGVEDVRDDSTKVLGGSAIPHEMRLLRKREKKKKNVGTYELEGGGVVVVSDGVSLEAAVDIPLLVTTMALPSDP